MSDQETKELNAFFAFFTTFDLARPVSTISDLSDGAALFEILSLVDADYFIQSSRTRTTQLSDNWILRFSTLKRLYRLLTQYFTDVLQKPTSGLEVPDLQAIAKDYDISATLVLCRMTIAIAVQSERNKEIIEKIQKLNESSQHQLMKAFEQVCSQGVGLVRASQSDHDIREVMTEDGHYYRIQSGRRHILAEKETIEKVYQVLLEDHRVLQTNFDGAISEKDDALARLREIQRDLENKRNDKADVMMRAEIDRLRSQFQKSEDNLAMAEAELDKQNGLVSELTRKADKPQATTDLAARLKDQVDEYRHAADELQKTENVMEKYKKKLQEGADLRQLVKSLERQNADLVDKNASLEEEYRKVAAFKPLMESYKNQIAELGAKVASRSQEMETVKSELEQTRTKLCIATEERGKDSEMLELYQERMRELELTSHRAPSTTKSSDREDSRGSMTTMTEEELMGEESFGLNNELDDALSGTTMTDLKLQIKKLQRELSAVKKNEADGSRVLVLENLLEDANRMKSRYEADYLAAHRENSAEAAIALRQRLNETVDHLDALRREHADLEVQFDTQKRELTIAKSDLNLINKDQVEIIASLRESVNEDKAYLEAEAERLKQQIKELGEKNRMQLEQVNVLLLEKVNLQSEGIGQREKMLQRERDIGDLRASLSGKDIPEDVKSRLLALREDNLNVKEQLMAAQEKLAKAKTVTHRFIGVFHLVLTPSSSSSLKTLFKEEQAKLASMTTVNIHFVVSSPRLTFYHMGGVIHHTGMHRLWSSYAQPTSKGKPEPSAWLGQQRKNVSLCR
ncbi:HOOK-domain-containing protein [Boletus coccyginus]|nr:HOOK-domain-containing protein [Boletus coccyginus]